MAAQLPVLENSACGRQVQQVQNDLIIAVFGHIQYQVVELRTVDLWLNNLLMNPHLDELPGPD